MPAPFETAHQTERCLVVHPHLVAQEQARPHQRSVSAQLEEAVGLSAAIHLEVVEALSFTVKRRTPKTLIGAGQVAHCRDIVEQQQIDVVIINHTLSPTQQRNLEKAMHAKVIDRTALILEIFGERAQTAEGKLQVELAALNYQKSRLVRSWTHLERQRGGHGFMGGPGESQIETDRRLIADRITLLKKQLDEVVRTRTLHRKTRRDTPYPLVALVGYTNAGKSTLFNRLTHAKVMAEDMLFATLDPTIRALTLPSGQQVMLSDTVGFISDLPHELVAAFRATLEEVREADLILHVRDIAHEDTQAQADDVAQVLSELLGETAWKEAPKLEIWNKIDALTAAQSTPQGADDTQVFSVSALRGDGCAALLTGIDQTLKTLLYTQKTYQLDYRHSGKALAWLHTHGEVLEQTDQDESVRVKVELRPADANRFEERFLTSR